MRHLLSAQDQDPAVVTGSDRLKARLNGCGARGRRRLDSHGRDAGQAHRVGDLRGDVALADKLFGVHRADIKRLDFLFL